jgi:hypothetical protein
MSDKSKIQQRLQKAINLPDEKKIYFTGFTVSISNVDVMISLERAGEPIAMLHTPHPVAKTLVEKLGNVISSFEEDSGYTFPSIQDMDEAVNKVREKDEQNK